MTPRRRAARGGAGGHEPTAVIQERAQRAWELEAAGWTQRQIATALGISQPAVSKILRRVADRLAAQLDAEQRRHLVRALNREAYLYREALRGYERSQRDHTRRRQRQVTNPDGAVVENVVEVDVLPRDGDPRFLEQAGRSSERAAALTGLTHGRSRSTTPDDPQPVRKRLARQLGRLADAAGSRPVARDDS